MAQLASCCFFFPTRVFSPLHRRDAVWQCGTGNQRRRRMLFLSATGWGLSMFWKTGECLFRLHSSISESSKIAKMLSLTCRRTLCSHRTLLPLKRMMANRHSSHIAAICSAHHFCNNDISSSRNDLRHSYTNFITSGNQRQGDILTKPVGSFRNYCASPVSQNCWNCKQPLDKPPAFFCLSCNVVQPPEEGTSYFKIMDW